MSTSKSARPEDSPGPPRLREAASGADGALLDRYRKTGDAEAFAEIVARYGPMVYRTCRRRLGSAHDAEDASQAVFLLLARQPNKAQGFLAGWLHGVARNTALTLVRARARRARREGAAVMRSSAATTAPAETLREELDGGIADLPIRLREAVILCYLEGRRQEEAAAMLGCSQSTLSRRAADGIERLRALLLRRGAVVTPAVLLACLSQQATAAVPPSLLSTLALAAASKAGAGLSASAYTLADAMTRAALAAKLKAVAAALLAAALLATGATLALRGRTSTDAVVFLNFDGPNLPTNQAGDGYPKPCRELDAEGIDGGRAELSLEPVDAVAGRSLRARLFDGRLKLHFTPEGKRGRKTFARDYVADPAAWRFNTCNRLVFWIKCPAGSPPHSVVGGSNMNVGTLYKRVKDFDEHSLDAGGGGFAHRLNVPALDCWTMVVLNAHANFCTGDPLEKDPGNRPHPTGEPDYCYFDALTHFYVEARGAPAQYPLDYLLDEMEFRRETRPENDDQVYSIAATYVPVGNRLILTWSRRNSEDAIAHEVRYGFEDIHGSGWQKAQPAPGGVIVPPGRGIANGMVYDSRDLPLAGRRQVYIAMKPKNSDVFSQIAVPLIAK